MGANDPKTDWHRAQDARDLVAAIDGLAGRLQPLRELAIFAAECKGDIEPYQALIRASVRHVGLVAHLTSALESISHDEDGCPYGENHGLPETPWPSLAARRRR